MHYSSTEIVIVLCTFRETVLLHLKLLQARATTNQKWNEKPDWRHIVLTLQKENNTVHLKNVPYTRLTTGSVV